MMVIIVAVYVVFGRIRGVMYTDTLQGTIMLIGWLSYYVPFTGLQAELMQATMPALVR